MYNKNNNNNIILEICDRIVEEILLKVSWGLKKYKIIVLLFTESNTIQSTYIYIYYVI